MILHDDKRDDSNADQAPEEKIETSVEGLTISDAELRTLFAAISDVIVVLDHEGRYLRIAPTAQDYLYRRPAELIGKTLHEVFPKQKADFFLAQVHHALDEGRMHRVD